MSLQAHFFCPVAQYFPRRLNTRHCLSLHVDYSKYDPSFVWAGVCTPTIDLASNARITGTIPSELALLDKLEWLDMTETAVTGTIPEELCTKAALLTIVANYSQIKCCQD